MSELYVDPPAVEAMIGALDHSKSVLDGVPTESFVARVEGALPGSGLGHAVMTAGFRSRAATRGAGGLIQEICDRARADIVEFLRTESQNVAGIEKAGESPR